MKGLCIQID